MCLKIFLNSLNEYYSILMTIYKTNVIIHHVIERHNIYQESGDLIPIQKKKTNWVMSPVCCQCFHYAIPIQIQFR